MKLLSPRLGRWILSGVVVAFLAVFATKVEWDESWQAVRGADVYLVLLAALVNLVSVLFKGMRWWIFIRPVAPSSLWLALRATLAGAGLNNILIANGGDAARVVFISRATGRASAKILASLAVERLFDVLLFVALLVVAAFFLELPFDVSAWRIPAAAGLLALLALALYLIRRTAGPGAHGGTGGRGSTLSQRVRSYMQTFVFGVTTLSTGRRFALAMVLSVLAWALQIYCFHLAAVATRFPISLGGTVACVLAVNVGMAIKPTPGNVGFFQFLYAVTAASFGLSGDDAVGVAFLIQALQTIPVTLIGIALAPEFIFKRKRYAAQDA